MEDATRSGRSFAGLSIAAQATVYSKKSFPSRHISTRPATRPASTRTSPRSASRPSTVAIETSKILGQVRDLSEKKGSSPADISKSTRSPSATESLKPAPGYPKKPVSKAPLAALNSRVVENIATRAGARPNASGSTKPLPPNYNQAARRVTATIVALPILLVTSWVLYERLVLKKEPKPIAAIRLDGPETPPRKPLS